MSGDAAPERESGRILLLALGLVVVGLMLVAMVASATAVHLDNKRLYNLADLLAASAADAATPSQHLAAAGAGPLLTDAGVARAVTEELADYPFPADLPADLQVVEASTPDGRTARVTVTARSHPPLLAWFTTSVGDGFALRATSSARASTGGP
ncbi:hypothetical protein [Xylanimonas protaetiae]|uniref:Uncharacterized protein n=1 Tax=Xylanimonas protaetiae TaxID=2509457 RepID=A0A4V0YG90_9MICO|nr:hypothetical protein [Xylanimonas protaetiae]QAY70381.1 hypothetical protein ET471_10345 [Xylanimonas protaetiae]